VALNRTFGGLKKVTRLDVSELLESVTPEVERDRPGTTNGPRLAPVDVVKQMSFVQFEPVME
jgi:hypothetical protein